VNRTMHLRALATLGVATLLLSACGGGGGGSSASGMPSTLSTNAAQPNFNTSSIPASLQIASWGEPTVRNASYIGPATNAQLSVNVLVHQQSAQALAQYAAQTANPASSNFHHWLTPQEIGQRFGATASDYQKVATYFQQAGLAVGAWPQRMLITVSGNQTSMQRAFGTNFGMYRGFGKTFIGPTSTPHFSTPLPVDAVSNLVAISLARTFLDPPQAGAAFGIGYAPQQVQGAFDYRNAYTLSNGSGITIGIIGTGPLDFVNSGSGSTPGCSGGSVCGQVVGTGDEDLNALTKLYSVNSVATVNEIGVTGNGVAAGLSTSGITPGNFPFANAFSTPPNATSPNCTGSLPSCNPEDGEAQLDVQQSATLAPGATVDFYLAYNQDCNTGFNTPCPTTGSNVSAPEIGLVESDPEIQQVIADNVADIISMSFGGGESQTFTAGDYIGSFSQLEFAALQAEGIAAFASSGDTGSAECENNSGTIEDMPCVSYPSGDPNVTSVGGVTAPINSLDQLVGSILAWGISTSDNGYGAMTAVGGASGGGVSTIIAAPPWQQADIPATMREQPDVSLIGDPSTGVTFECDAVLGGSGSGACPNGGGPSLIGGTSVSSPEMAAMWALVLGACKAHPAAGMCANGSGATPWRLGVAAPYLYAIFKGTPIGSVSPALPYTSVFYEVLYGSNEASTGVPSTPVPGASATAGYNEVTGIGVPFADHLIQAITGISPT
jgi:subtilase family serine protease